jgi:DNA-binding NarL/FixJ family response regulator
METAIVRVVVADDYEPWRRFVLSTLEKQPRYRVVCEASDGLDAVQKAQALQPDLILLDLRLPKLSGIEAARQIRESAPKSKILFLSENRSGDIAEYVVRTSASGYVVKSNAVSELLPAMEAVLHGEQFIGAGLTDHLREEGNATTHDRPGQVVIATKASKATA